MKDKLFDSDILEVTYNDFFIEQLLVSALSTDAKIELVEFLHSQRLMNDSQYRLSIRLANRAEGSIQKLRNGLVVQSKEITNLNQ